jgi:hypothetical protein
MELFHPVSVHAQRALNALRPLRILPKVRIQRLVRQVFYFLAAVIDVKDTSLKQPAGLLSPLIARQS